MNISPELVKKFLSNECTPEEADFLVQYFQEHPAAAEMYFGEQEWASFEATGTLPAADDKAIWKEVQRQSFDRKGIVHMSLYKRIATAAAIIICAGTATWFLQQRRTAPVNNIAMVQPADSIHFTTITNRTDAQQCVALEDGSEVMLMQNSTLNYQQPFGKNDRKLSLTGRAFFTVTHSSSKPFSVSASGITTTALGTSFWVDAPADTKTVNVKLVSGRIVVKQDVSRGTSFKDMYLTPGQALTYDPALPQVQLTDMAHQPETKAVHATEVSKKKADEIILAFDQTPLTDVLKQLQQHYHVKIEFDETQLANVKFSGSYTAADNVATILKTIALANDLKLETTPAGYHVAP